MNANKCVPKSCLAEEPVSPIFKDQKRHMKLWHVKLSPVTTVTGLPGRVPGQQDLCSLRSENSTCIFDPWPPGQETAPSPEGSPAQKDLCLCAFQIFFREMCFEFQDFGHRERQTCCEAWVDTARHLVPTFCAGCD